MNMDALIVSTEAGAEINRLNATKSLIRLVPVACADGRKVLHADLLEDCGPGQTWADYASVLTTLPTEDVAMPELPEE